MLLTRCVLFIAFSTAHSDSALRTNMFITNLVVLGILVYKTVSTKIYQQLYVSLLELCFLVNVEVLSASVYYAYLKNDLESTVCKITSASISLSLLGFAVILAYHAHLQLRKTKFYLSLKLRILKKCPSFLQRAHTQNDTIPPSVHETDTGSEARTTTFFQLREALLASQEPAK